MGDLGKAHEINREAVAEMLRAIDSLGQKWSEPWAPGKWTRAQVVEHVARSYEIVAGVVRGDQSGMPRFPRLLRWLARLYFNKVLRDRKFPKTRTTRAFVPERDLATPAEGRSRLEAAVAAFEAVAGPEAGERRILHPTWGEISLAN
ncbi:MAG TPA: maleylpyruvate isomerase N-terminal domain-containing protein, partial [Gemmatimonadales bacterium]|nr:maleylpyruvate isomerase N-terminal domain-containing protein [Gemmatimonadales bacterium]